MILHPFKPEPHGRDVCDQKCDEDGRVEFCGQRRSEHMDETHALKIQLATALRERDTYRDDAAYFKTSYQRKLADEKRLLESLSDWHAVEAQCGAVNCHCGCHLYAKELAAPADGEEGKR